MADKKTCFVVMGFGKKTDFETSRTLDLDKTYFNLIKPAIEEAGLDCIRADEIVHSGLIDVPMYERLLNADVVVADLSTSNRNAYYELGVRHALRPYTTVVIIEDGTKALPFDVSHVAIRQYHHLGEDIGVTEAGRFKKLLTDAVREIMRKDPRDGDSPVYRFIEGLNPPAFAAAMKATAKVLNKEPEAAPDAKSVADPVAAATHSALMKRVDEAQKLEDFATAKALLGVVRESMKEKTPERSEERPEDPYIIQRLALLTYKSKSPSERAALEEARGLLTALAPDTSNDPETLGLWGAVHKRLWDLLREDDPAKAAESLDESVRAYERGFYLRNDYYNGINFAYLLNVRAAHAEGPAEAVADFVQARRVRAEVLGICDRWLKDNLPPDEGKVGPKGVDEYLSAAYWVRATRAEALIGLGDASGEPELQAAYAASPQKWMRKSTEEQVGKLRPLLADSPLAKYLKVG